MPAAARLSAKVTAANDRHAFPTAAPRSPVVDAIASSEEPLADEIAFNFEFRFD
jgi:hypothetical protein